MVTDRILMARKRLLQPLTLAEGWAKLPWYMRSWLWTLDVALNQLWRHGPGETIPKETISTRLAKSRARGERIGIHGCKILDAADPGHCQRALDYPDFEDT